MQWKDNLTHFILAGVVVFCLTLLMVVVDAQAQIVFASERDGNWQIYVMANDGDNQRNLSNNDFDDQYPSWSPDGKHIAFVSEREGSRDIYVMDADGENPQNLTNNRRNDWNPSWSPDGKRIAFVALRGNMEIYVMDADGKNSRNLTKNPHDDTDPAWYNPAFAVVPAGKKLTMWGRLRQVNR